MKENQIQNRLLQWPHVRTAAIFQVDDDILIEPENVVLGFHVWQGFSDRLIGYSARDFEMNSASGMNNE